MIVFDKWSPLSNNYIGSRNWNLYSRLHPYARLQTRLFPFLRSRDAHLHKYVLMSATDITAISLDKTLSIKSRIKEPLRYALRIVNSIKFAKAEIWTRSLNDSHDFNWRGWRRKRRALYTLRGGSLSDARSFRKLDLEFKHRHRSVRVRESSFSARARSRCPLDKFKRNSSFTRYQWRRTDLDRVFSLLFALFLRIASHCVSPAKPTSLPLPRMRPTMTTRRTMATAVTATTTTTTTRFHLIKFALYQSARCGGRSLSKSREIWRRAAGWRAYQERSTRANERTTARVRRFAPNEIEKSIDSIAASFW